MHVSAIWIAQEYLDSAGCYEGWHGFIQTLGMFKDISVLRELISMIFYLSH